MKNEKVYIEGYVVGSFADTLGNRGKQIQLINGDIVDIDDNFIYKSIEPQKVVVPQFVADWIEQCKAKRKRLLTALLYTPEKVNSWVDNPDNQKLFARAYLDGYEVEKEPKYTVKFKATNQYLCDDDGIGLHISPSFRSNFRKSDLEKLSLTEVFDSPLFEVEEV